MRFGPRDHLATTTVKPSNPPRGMNDMTTMRRRATSEDAEVEVQKTEPTPESAVAAVSCLSASPPKRRVLSIPRDHAVVVGRLVARRGLGG